MKIIKDHTYIPEKKALDYLIMGKIKSIFKLEPFIVKKVQYPINKYNLHNIQNINFNNKFNKNKSN